MMLAFIKPGPAPGLLAGRAACSRRSHADLAPTTDSVISSSDDLRVLIAEVDPRDRAASCRVLESHGFEVDVVRSGEEAVKRHVRDPFDLILMEVRMPGMEGYRAACAIREREAETDRPVGIVGMTSRASGEDLSADPQGVMDDCLSKPVDARDLAEVIDPLARGLIEQHGGDGEREALPTVREPASGWDESEEAEGGDPEGMIDVNALVRSLDGDRAFAAELLESFRDTFPQYVEALDEALDEDDAPGVRDAAHQLKGSLHAVRSDEPADAAEAVELAAREADLGRVRRLMRRLRSLLEALDAEIDDVLRSL